MALWIHPSLVHFAIGLLLAGVLFDLFGWLRTSEKLVFAGYWNTVAGAAAVVVAALTGLYSEAHLGPHSNIGHALLSFHKMFAWLCVALSVGLAGWRIAMRGYVQPRVRIPYFASAFFTAGLIFITGSFGGTLVYLYGLGVGPETARRVLEAQPTQNPAYTGYKRPVPRVVLAPGLARVGDGGPATAAATASAESLDAGL
jgi:uncharacterized membrane protein